jgi:hypothetical protein
MGIKQEASDAVQQTPRPCHTLSLTCSSASLKRRKLVATTPGW